MDTINGHENVKLQVNDLIPEELLNKAVSEVFLPEVC